MNVFNNLTVSKLNNRFVTLNLTKIVFEDIFCRSPNNALDMYCSLQLTLWSALFDSLLSTRAYPRIQSYIGLPHSLRACVGPLPSPPHWLHDHPAAAAGFCLTHSLRRVNTCREEICCQEKTKLKSITPGVHIYLDFTRTMSATFFFNEKRLSTKCFPTPSCTGATQWTLISLQDALAEGVRLTSRSRQHDFGYMLNIELSHRFECHFDHFVDFHFIC